MDTMTAKTELVVSHYLHALNQVCDHFRDLGDVDGLMDIRRAAEATVDTALQRVRPVHRLEQEIVSDSESGRIIR